ncbi:MAG TPA: prepilin peptidase, partial [Terracidiphilus sp.]|nr:prepilin peptidase [Terracidiphilus sp.]
TVFAALAGLAFGSFLNVCLTRWPQGESIVAPRSHCRNCNRALAWWENVPLASWIALRGRCRTCKAWIGWRYPLVELAVSGLWAAVGWQSSELLVGIDFPGLSLFALAVSTIGQMLFYWLLVGLAVLDAENLWLPDWLTLPGILIGFVLSLLNPAFDLSFDKLTLLPLTYDPTYLRSELWRAAIDSLFAILAAAFVILLIRWSYRLLRRREGIGLGDAKLMALLAAWLGFSRSLLAFVFGVVLGSLVALVMLALLRQRKAEEPWSTAKLPLGTFLCIGGIAASLWGSPIIAAYLHWAGFY